MRHREADANINHPTDRTLTVTLSVRIADSMDQPFTWVTPLAAGLAFLEPAKRISVDTCVELRTAIADLGTAVLLRLSPQEYPQFRVLAHDTRDDALVGTGHWIAQGTIFLTADRPRTRCSRIGQPGHECNAW
ncbi:hypothetical protein ACWD6P_10720 [Streptomyces sp. NPDC002446]